MSIEAKCTSCGHEFRRPDGLAGKLEKCPKCHRVMRLPIVPLESAVDHRRLEDRTASETSFAGNLAEERPSLITSPAQSPTGPPARDASPRISQIDETNERFQIWREASEGAEVQVEMCVQWALMPARHGSHASVGQAYFTNAGIFYIELASMNMRVANEVGGASRVEMLGAWAIGGVTGALGTALANSLPVVRSEPADREEDRAYNCYESNKQRWITPGNLFKSFNSSRRMIQHFAPEEIVGFRGPSWSRGDTYPAYYHIETVFGSLCVPADCTRVETWWNTYRPNVGSTLICWTPTKVIRYLRGNQDLSRFGLLKYLCDAGSDPKNGHGLWRTLSDSLSAGTFWRIVAVIWENKGTSAREAARAAAAVQRPSAIKLSLASGAAVLGAGIALLWPPFGDRARTVLSGCVGWVGAIVALAGLTIFLRCVYHWMLRRKYLG